MLLFRLVSSFIPSLLLLVQIAYGNIEFTSLKSDQDNLDTPTCNRFQCFDSLRCKFDADKQLSYYVYPPLRLNDSSGHIVYSTSSMMSYEFWKLLETFLTSGRLTRDPDEACIFIPSIDLAWLHANSSIFKLEELLNSLPFWKHVDSKPGTNHMIVSMDPTLNSNEILNSIGRAILVSCTHDTWTLRPDFDLSIPVLSERSDNVVNGNADNGRSWSIVTTQFDSFSEDQRLSISNLKKLLKKQLLVLGSSCPSASKTVISPTQNAYRCCKEDEKIYEFPNVLSRAHYCLIVNVGLLPSADAAHYLLVEAMRHGCIPIIASDYILPFDSLIDWSSVSISLTNSEILESLGARISSISDGERAAMSAAAEQIWSTHFKNSSQVTRGIARHYDSLIYPKVFLRQ